MRLAKHLVMALAPSSYPSRPTFFFFWSWLYTLLWRTEPHKSFRELLSDVHTSEDHIFSSGLLEALSHADLQAECVKITRCTCCLAARVPEWWYMACIVMLSVLEPAGWTCTASWARDFIPQQNTTSTRVNRKWQTRHGQGRRQQSSGTSFDLLLLFACLSCDVCEMLRMTKFLKDLLTPPGKREKPPV